jgi:hypothetical protein
MFFLSVRENVYEAVKHQFIGCWSEKQTLCKVIDRVSVNIAIIDRVMVNMSVIDRVSLNRNGEHVGH